MYPLYLSFQSNHMNGIYLMNELYTDADPIKLGLNGIDTFGIDIFLKK